MVRQRGKRFPFRMPAMGAVSPEQDENLKEKEAKQ
jgi:hypothetical protein